MTPDPNLCPHLFTKAPSDAHCPSCPMCLHAEVLRLRADLAECERRAKAAEEELAEMRETYSETSLTLSPEEIHVRDYDDRRSLYGCKVCQNVPDHNGYLEHGKGCYTQDENGGGTEYVEEADLTKEAP